MLLDRADGSCRQRNANSDPCQLTWPRQYPVVLRYLEAFGEVEAGDLHDEKAQRRTRAVHPRVAVRTRHLIRVGAATLLFSRILSGSPKLRLLSLIGKGPLND